MHDFTAYKAELVIFIIVIVIVGFVLFTIGNLLLWGLKRSRVFYERKVWVLSNVMGVIMMLVCIIPPALDIYQSSYCTISNAVSIEYDIKTKYSSKYVLITDSNGKVYTCYDYLIDAKSLEGIEFPITVVYAKHSKLILRVYTSAGSE